MKIGYLFDTNAAIALHRQAAELNAIIDDAVRLGEEISFSVITKSEFIAGLPLNTKLEDVPFLMGEFINVNSHIAVKAGRIRREQKDLHGRKLKTPDALILATAIEYNLVLVTSDRDLQFAKKDYGVQVIDFSDGA
ncbi:PIN domain-containing protein [Paenibacillus terreus]|uniref:Ribonuclease VapC n=1 Tax=Paenibacillus terreus TaxID=1387834 RepID=A0ABV5B631_9BACL